MPEVEKNQFCSTLKSCLTCKKQSEAKTTKTVKTEKKAKISLVVNGANVFKINIEQLNYTPPPPPQPPPP